MPIDKRFERLREAAENSLKKTLSKSSLTDTSIDSVLHELSVHQIELELQNEELQQAQQKLVESRNLYLNLYNNAPVAYLIVDGNGYIRKANQTFLKLLGINSDTAVISKLLVDFIHYEDLNIFYSVYKTFFKSPEKSPFEIRLKTQDGIKFVNVTGMLQSGGMLTDNTYIGECCLMVLNDITELKLLDEEVKKQNIALEALNNQLQENVQIETEKRLKHENLLFEQQKFVDMGQMINSIAHQWRQPLNALGLMLQLQEQDIKDGQYSEFVERQAIGMELIHHMSQTIDDFRNFFSPDRERKQFNVAYAVFSALKLVQKQLENNGVQLFLNCSCDVESYEISSFDSVPKCLDNDVVMVNGYPGEFKQVILNIIQNSKDAILENDPDNGIISAKISVSGSTISIVIEDNGGGIKNNVITKAFDPYFTTKEEGKGTGIGLYMSKVILTEHMDGNIRIEGVENGTRCTIELKSAV